MSIYSEYEYEPFPLIVLEQYDEDYDFDDDYDEYFYSDSYNSDNSDNNPKKLTREEARELGYTYITDPENIETIINLINMKIYGSKDMNLEMSCYIYQYIFEILNHDIYILNKIKEHGFKYITSEYLYDEYSVSDIDKNKINELTQIMYNLALVDFNKINLHNARYLFFMICSLIFNDRMDQYIPSKMKLQYYQKRNLKNLEMILDNYLENTYIIYHLYKQLFDDFEHFHSYFKKSNINTYYYYHPNFIVAMLKVIYKYNPLCKIPINDIPVKAIYNSYTYYSTNVNNDFCSMIKGKYNMKNNKITITNDLKRCLKEYPQMFNLHTFAIYLNQNTLIKLLGKVPFEKKTYKYILKKYVIKLNLKHLQYILFSLNYYKQTLDKELMILILNNIEDLDKIEQSIAVNIIKILKLINIV